MRRTEGAEMTSLDPLLHNEPDRRFRRQTGCHKSKFGVFPHILRVYVCGRVGGARLAVRVVLGERTLLTRCCTFILSFFSP